MTHVPFGTQPTPAGVTLSSAGQSGIHPSPAEFTDAQIRDDQVLRYFHYRHLPPALQNISASFCTLAGLIVERCPRNPERTVALRKLLEAKDAAVRANVPDQAPAPETFFDRLVTERRELAEKIRKLGAFLNGGAIQSLNPDERDLLDDQHTAMQVYASVLDARIERLTNQAALASELPVEGEVRTTGGDKSEEPLPFS